MAWLERIWKTLSDLCTLDQILGWILGVGWKTWLLIIVSGLATSITAALLHAPTWAILGFGLAAALIVVGVSIGLLELRHYWHKRKVVSPIKVEYQEGVGSYFHEFPTHRPGLGKGTGQLVRIKVSHEGSASIDNVQVKVQEIVPPQDIKGVPFHLHRMNDNPLHGSSIPFQTFTNLAHKQEEYFDVATYSKFIMSTSILEFNCIDGKAREIKEYPAEIVIRVTGKDAKMAECRFMIDVDEQDNLKMTMRDEP